MTPELVFSVVNLAAALSWVLLVVLPRQRWVSDTLAGIGVPVFLAAVYIVLVATNWGSTAGGFSTLANVALLFANPWMLLAGWIHYLCFDLLIGCWEVRDARERGVPHLLVVPCLLATFMFGPAGWLLYRAIRAGHNKPGLPA